MADFDNYISGLLDQVKGLFGQQQKFNQPGSMSAPPGTQGNRIISPESYTAPIHGSWASSGGFTYHPSASHPTGHMGVDMRAPGGTAVYPMAPGIVSSVGSDPKGGNVVNITHTDGVRSYYAHLATVAAQKGDKVNTDTIIGTVGESGNAQGGIPHLHFQVWKNDQIRDPAQFFSVPKYTDLSPQEKKQGPWLSEKAKQDAQAFKMKEHLSQRRAAFTREVNKLVKLASHFQVLANLSPQQARAILGVPVSATPAEINRAYKRLAVQYHPDRNRDNPQAAAKIVEINNARDVLLFPERQGPVSDFAKQTEEEQTAVNEVLNEEQRKADEWVADVQSRRAMGDEWDDYMFGNIGADQLKHPENIAKAPAVEEKRRKHKEKLEKAKQRRDERRKTLSSF